MTDSDFSVTPCTGGLGAFVSGIDLSVPLDDSRFNALYAAWLEYCVLIFRDQSLTPATQLVLARRFGTSMEKLEFIPAHPDYEDVQVISTNPDWKPQLFIDWHTDVSWKEVPTLGAILYCLERPEGAGDTLWANMCAVYDALSEPMQKFLEGLTGVHDGLFGREASMIASMGAKAFQAAREAYPLVEHPLVAVHPETGRHVLYVNPLFLSHIKELGREESDALLSCFYKLSEQPEFQCRLQWEPGTVALFDNCSTIHKVVNDFWPRERTMHRIAINAENRPQGV
ncbi:MAG: hypothetical protein CL799_06440 [Chromatiales bacterium]|jgi:taurine dioxygenase|nr:hypothetical protein [Chromatiales bacterium]MDP7094079.1 TauD/TfdA family dioxygenase [Gammaproteobacteria bacterium]MDP7271325.1 TauD/TfdA family dioxygenase [Gammaproteobacteria bacterium]HJP05093.1 TauD/TfdA family dioxygenase [Gammaproteobacteria bacterium]